MLTTRTISAYLIMLAVCTLAAAPVSAGPFTGLQRLFKDWGLLQGVQISGTNDLTFQQSMVQGSASAFEGQRWDTAPIVRRSSLTLEGPIWKELHFQAALSSSGFGSSYSNWVVGYVGHDTALYYGDLNIDLSGNQFASFTKPVSGWQLDQKVGKGMMRAFYSQEKAITRTQIIAGNNTSGPFFLTYTPVMQGTEIVKVNEQVQRFGVDYRLDYESGQLWFETDGTPPKIIPDTATITVSYQSAGYQSSAGTLSGARALFPLLNDRLQVGLTMLKQDRGGSAVARDTIGYQEDIFNGSGSTGPFDVNFRPILINGTTGVYKGKPTTISQALLVLVDNVEQAEGVDYDSYRQIGRIIFRRSVPPTALVIIRYYYDLSNSVAATNNDIVGLDLLYHVTPKLDLSAEYGKSDGGLTSNSGQATRLNLNYSTPRLKLVSEYRDISPTFTFMDSVGFYRQDKGMDTGVTWQPLEHVNVFAHHSDVKTNQGYSFGSSLYGNYSTYGTMQTQANSTSNSLDVNSKRTDFEVRLDFPSWPTLGFQHQEMSNSGGSSASSTYRTNNVQLNWAPTKSPFMVTANLNQTAQNYLRTATGLETLTSTGTSTRQMQWSAAYRPSDKFSISFNQGRNNSDSVGTTSTSSSSTNQLSVRWTPSSKFDVNLDRSSTSSVGSVRGSSYSTYGIGDGSGIGGGGGSNTTENRYTDDSSRLSVRYAPSQRLSFDFALNKRDYTSGGSVGYLADSNQLTKSLSMLYQLNDSLTLNASFNKDTLVFLEEGRGTVANNLTTLAANYRKPDSLWNLTLSVNKMTGSSPTYTGYGSNQKMRVVANDMSDLQARVGYTMHDGSEIALTGQLSDYAGGYANFNKQQLELTYGRRISDLANLTFGYRFIRNISNGLDDPRYGNTSLTPASQNYLANTFLLQVTTQFNGSIGSGNPSISGFGSGSLSNFTGYRAGLGVWGNNNSQSYGTGYGFQNMGVFGNRSTSLGSGFSSPFGDSYNSSSNFGTTPGVFGSTNQRPQGYENFEAGAGNPSGFTTGLGDVNGQHSDDPFGASGTQPGGIGQPSQDLQDWYNLDDMYSIWW